MSEQFQISNKRIRNDIGSMMQEERKLDGKPHISAALFERVNTQLNTEFVSIVEELRRSCPISRVTGRIEERDVYEVLGRRFKLTEDGIKAMKNDLAVNMERLKQRGLRSKKIPGRKRYAKARLTTKTTAHSSDTSGGDEQMKDD